MAGLPRTSTSSVLTALLAVGLLVTVMLLLMLSRLPRAQISVSAPSIATCPENVRAPVCYEAQLRNPGSIATTAHCDVMGGPGSLALFTDRRPDYTTADPIPPNSAVVMQIEVRPAGSDTLLQPTLSCVATGG